MLFADWFASRPIEVPPQLLAAGFEDTSWHNDAMPSMHFRATETSELVVCAWIGDELSKEDCGGGMFALEVGQCDESGAWVDGYDDTRKCLYNGDDLAEMLRLALDAAERLKAGATLDSFHAITE